MQYDNLPIYKSSMDLCVYIETIVKSFGKYEKYTIGDDLRIYSKDILFLIHKANISLNKKNKLEELRDKCEELKMLLQLCKEMKSFKSFKQFEVSSKMTVSVAKQSQAWLNHYARVSK
jgi:hypothetical protein